MNKKVLTIVLVVFFNYSLAGLSSHNILNLNLFIAP